MNGGPVTFTGLHIHNGKFGVAGPVVIKYRTYPDDAQPICEPGATLEVVPDDGSAAFAEMWEVVKDGKRVLRRTEEKV